METSLRDKSTWLHDLVHDNMSSDEIVGGFVKFYTLRGLSVDHVQQDIHFHMPNGDEYIKNTMGQLRNALEGCVQKAEPPEAATSRESSY